MPQLGYTGQSRCLSSEQWLTLHEVSVMKAELGQRCLSSLHFKGDILWTNQVLWWKPQTSLFLLQEMVSRLNA